MWDEMVDVVTVGAGPAGLACAVAAADAGLDVLVTTPAPAGAPAPAQTARGWLPVVDDPATSEYFAELAAELPSLQAPELAMRNVYNPAPPDTGRRAGRRAEQVETFVGARLWDWAARCLGSPHGVLFTRVAYWPSVAMRTTGGSAVEVVTLAEVTAEGKTLDDWLADLVADREIDVLAEAGLQRIVFGEDSRIEGVVVDTPDGPHAVQARLGIAVSPGFAVSSEQVLDIGARISLVGQRAGRFGRLEVLREVDPPA